ncbi:glycine betaine ABC transporter substrate-binding protein [Sphingomonas sp. MMS24-JH45]
MREAADGIGMTPWQKLRLVEAPLVLPVATAGVRTAAVWTIGAATLSTTVPAKFGDLIFAGLQTQAWTLVLAGRLSAAALAVVDATLAIAEAGGAAAAGVGVGRDRAVGGGDAGGELPLMDLAERRVVIGAKNFSEQYILARLIGDRLERAGYRVDYRDGLGSAVAFGAVAGEADAD